MPGSPTSAHTVGLRPEHIRLSEDGPLQLKIRQVEQLGSSSILHGSVAGDTPFEVILPGQTTFQRGDAVCVVAAAEDMHYFDAAGLRL